MIEMVTDERVKLSQQDLYFLLKYKAHVMQEEQQWNTLEEFLESSSEKFLNKVTYHEYML